MARGAYVLAHWHVLLDDFETSALDFYSRVENALQLRGIPELKTERVQWYEGGVFTAKREYLRAGRGRLTYDICAAPYGTRGYFFSSWMAVQPPKYVGVCLTVYLIIATLILFKGGGFTGFFINLFFLLMGFLLIRASAEGGSTEAEDILLAMPIFGPIYRWLFRQETYYAKDTRLMFQESVQRAISEVIGDLREAKGLRALSPDELRPTLRDTLGS